MEDRNPLAHNGTAGLPEVTLAPRGYSRDPNRLSFEVLLTITLMFIFLARTVSDIIELGRVDWLTILIHALVIALIIWRLLSGHAQKRHARLVLTPEGMTYYASPKARGDLIRWADVKSIKLSTASVINFDRMTLTFDAGDLKRTVQPLHWVDVTESETLTKAELRTKLRHSLEPERLQFFYDTPLAKYLREAGFQVQRELLQWPIRSDLLRDDFALESSWHTLGAMGIMAALGLYILAEILLNEEAYVVQPLIEIFWGIALVVAGGTYVWLRWAEIPINESVGLAVLVGCIAGSAAYFGLLRINQMTDPVGLRPYLYVLQEGYTLKAQEPNLPILALKRIQAYWEQCEVGSVHKLYLRRGGLGFYQIDLGPIFRASYYDRCEPL